MRACTLVMAPLTMLVLLARHRALYGLCRRDFLIHCSLGPGWARASLEGSWTRLAMPRVIGGKLG